jgi:site-specific DNA-methyltransferase (adenine-specific)
MDTNVLYYGDNLEILRKYIPDSSVDLIYLDPPFNSKATYNVLYKEQTGEPSQAQITAFEDTWHWGLESEKALQEIFASPIAPPAVKDFMSVIPKFLGKKTDMAAYLTMMCVRLLELRRVLKDTGSIYLHCDPTASHYLKILMDATFGVSNFRNEIIWKRKSGRVYSKNSFGQKNDILLFYSKSENNYFQQLFSLEQAKEYIRERFVYTDEHGRQYMRSPLNNPDVRPNLMYEYKGYSPPAKGWAVSKRVMEQMDKEGRLYFPPDKSQRISRKIYLDEYEGQPISNIWVDIPFINPMAKERLGYPTQKPEALLERIIKASSNEGDIVLDPFCGCGTALVVAHKLNRKWIGIDITHLAISTMKWRLEKMFPNIQYKVVGEPKDLESAKELANQNKYQFQWWAVSLVGGQPYGDKKKGADTGIDGYLYFMDEKNKVKKAIIQVKAGNVSVSQMRDLIGVIQREKAEMGLFLCLESVTKPMQMEADSQGFYHSPLGKDYPKIQIFTIEQLLEGKKPDIPPWIAPVDTPPTAKKTEGKAVKML